MQSCASLASHFIHSCRIPVIAFSLNDAATWNDRATGITSKSVKKKREKNRSHRDCFFLVFWFTGAGKTLSLLPDHRLKDKITIVIFRFDHIYAGRHM